MPFPQNSLDLLLSLMKKGSRVSPSCPHLYDPSTGIKHGQTGDLVSRLELVDPLLENSKLRHSMGRMWLPLQSHIMQSLLDSLTLKFPQEENAIFSGWLQVAVSTEGAR